MNREENACKQNANPFICANKLFTIFKGIPWSSGFKSLFLALGEKLYMAQQERGGR